MATATLNTLVTAVRAEAGHALSASQGLNALETLKYLIQRTQYELWTAFQWPTLEIMEEISAFTGQHVYAYPASMDYDQVRCVEYASSPTDKWHLVSFDVPRECIAPGGGNTNSGPHAQFWDVYDETSFRIWPTPTTNGIIRLTGMKHLAPLVDDGDRCTLDATLLTLRVAAELLQRAKAADAEIKMQSFQRHLQKTLGNKVSAKNKVSTMGATRRIEGPRPFYDFVP